jgi:hypothetical protein
MDRGRQMPDSLRWNTEDKKRAHARILEVMMKLRGVSGRELVSILGDKSLKSPNTIGRWKTLQVKPNRPVYLYMLRNIFQLDYEQIDAMLWIAGMPSLLKKEVKNVFGSDGTFKDRTETELFTEAYKMLVEVIGNDLGLPAPAQQIEPADANEDVGFKFIVDTLKNNQIIDTTKLPMTITGRYQPQQPQPYVWVVLQDIYGSYYLQSPQVSFLSDGKWVADNIVPGRGIMAIHFVSVGAKNHEAFMNKFSQRDWGAFYDMPSGCNIIKSIAIKLIV